MIETNSFGGTVYKLERYGLGNKVFELNKAAAEISRKAAGNKFVLGSVGPTGKLLLMGDVSAEELYQAFKVQVTGLMEGGADAIMIETMSDLDEALIAIRAAKEFTNLEVFCTMTFEKTLTGDYRTMMGITPTEMVHALIPAGVDVTGANCGNGMADMLKIVEEIRSINFQIPVLVHANAGMPVLNDGITIYPEKPEDMGALVPPLIKAGVNIIGGCCGTTPNHIMKIRQALKLY